MYKTGQIVSFVVFVMSYCLRLSTSKKILDYNGQKFVYFDEIKLSMTSAQLACLSTGGQLLLNVDTELLSVFESRLTKGEDIWTQVYKVNGKRNYVGLNGQIISIVDETMVDELDVSEITTKVQEGSCRHYGLVGGVDKYRETCVDDPHFYVCQMSTNEDFEKLNQTMNTSVDSLHEDLAKVNRRCDQIETNFGHMRDHNDQERDQIESSVYRHVDRKLKENDADYRVYLHEELVKVEDSVHNQTDYLSSQLKIVDTRLADFPKRESIIETKLADFDNQLNLVKQSNDASQQSIDSLNQTVRDWKSRLTDSDLSKTKDIRSDIETIRSELTAVLARTVRFEQKITECDAYSNELNTNLTESVNSLHDKLSATQVFVDKSTQKLVNVDYVHNFDTERIVYIIIFVMLIVVNGVVSVIVYKLKSKLHQVSLNAVASSHMIAMSEFPENHKSIDLTDNRLYFWTWMVIVNYMF